MAINITNRVKTVLMLSVIVNTDIRKVIFRKLRVRENIATRVPLKSTTEIKSILYIGLTRTKGKLFS